MNRAPTHALRVPGWSIRAWRVEEVAALARAANAERILESVQPRSAFKRGEVIDRALLASHP